MAFIDFRPMVAAHALESVTAIVFTPLEHQVIAIARNDRLWTVRPRGRIEAAIGWIFDRRNPRLSDAKLEALRRIAVLGWWHGYAVAGSELKAFLSAGYTPDHYELLMRGIVTTRAAEPRRRAGHRYSAAPARAQEALD